MKRLLLVCLGSNTGNIIKEQIKDIIGAKVTIEIKLVSQINNMDRDYDLVLFTSEFIAKWALPYFYNDMPSIIAKRVINHKNIKDVISLKCGLKVLLVNDSKESACEAIEQLKEIGLDHIEYFPYYPGCKDYPQLDTAITPGEVHLIPGHIKNIIDIGSRILDIRTIYEITSKLGIHEVIEQSLVTAYIKDIVEISRSIESNRKSVMESQKLLETILNSVESGIAYTDGEGRIISVNSKFESIIGKKKNNILTKKLTTIFESLDIFSEYNTSQIVEIEGREVLLGVQLVNYEENFGYLLTATYTEKISKLDHKIRRNYQKRLSRKLYTFKDYLTINAKVKSMLKKAEKFSQTDATILIQGENGTGKEILAQAIHMRSYRRKNPFIPINITAISPTLLESELFGYEEGAFTGAKKGGKIGIFEIANGGTIFIDEIGDAPLDFQVKLLRVLEEKRVRRVGAFEEIPVDIRIIAATNKNLLQLIDEGTFREDLFFRLNILPLNTIPLRYRRDDIIYLIMHFINGTIGKGKKLKIEDVFEDEVICFLENYNWRGNVRELVNLVEYISYIYEGQKIDMSSLPVYMTKSKKGNFNNVILDENELWVLKEIYNSNSIGIGRQALTMSAKKQNVNLGEGKIRRILKNLEEKEVIVQKSRNQGCIITEKGKKAIDFYR